MNLLRLANKITNLALTSKNVHYFASRVPTFSSVTETQGDWIKVVHTSEAEQFIPTHKLPQFKKEKTTTIVKQSGEGAEVKENISKFYSENSWKKVKDISKNVSVMFSTQIQKSNNFVGLASQILTKGYKYSRKQKAEKQIQIKIEDFVGKDYVVQLAKSKMQAAQWANSRGNEINTNQLLKQAERIATTYPEVKIKIIRGAELLNEGFNLLHAVGRASKNEPIFVNLEWNGDKDNDQFLSIVGKGLCFDAGGLNLKPTSGISGMHSDKHGACSVLSAFESAVKLKLKSNIVASIGLAENFVSSNSYRPLDIIKSRKGLTVQIGNTDAEGRLVLADCMNWVQQNYKVKTMLELSTLTGAITIALGKERAGVFTNSATLATQILKRGQEIQELGWHLPVDEYHEELIKPKFADLTNSSGKPDGSSSQAAAFLKQFVEAGVEWAHIDIAGTSMADNSCTGYGAKLLIHFAKNRAL